MRTKVDEMNNHRFILQPYKGPSSRHTCPACGKRRCFSRYIDTENAIALPDDIGRCDHEQSCGYHKTPKDYFSEHPDAVPSQASAIRKPELSKPRRPSFIDAKIVAQSLRGYAINNFHRFLVSRFGSVDAGELVQRYRVGTSKHWDGACVFWQTDRNNRVHAGKVMLYDPESGKRVKQPFNHVTWVHSLLRLNDFNLQQCLFGEHLLSERPGDPVALVESEKSAIIASWYLPQYVWLATGGKHGCFNETALRCLRGRQVTLFPDLGATTHWSGKMELMKRLGIDMSLFDFM